MVLFNYRYSQVEVANCLFLYHHIRIQSTKINADPVPQYWYKCTSYLSVFYTTEAQIYV